MRGFTSIGLALMIWATILDSTVMAEKVTFKGTAQNSDEYFLTGEMMKPEGNGPFPAVVLLRGCPGMKGREHDWMERLIHWGFVVLQMDTFALPGEPKARWNKRTLEEKWIQARMVEAEAGKKYLGELPFVDSKRIMVMGWSNGGISTLSSGPQRLCSNKGCHR